MKLNQDGHESVLSRMAREQGVPLQSDDKDGRPWQPSAPPYVCTATDWNSFEAQLAEFYFTEEINDLVEAFNVLMTNALRLPEAEARRRASRQIVSGFQTRLGRLAQTTNSPRFKETLKVMSKAAASLESEVL